MPDPKLQIILAAKDITGKALTKFQSRIAAITKSVFSFKGLLGTLTGAGGFGVLITRSLEAADAIGKTADKLGISTTKLQEYRYAAERSGVETKTLDMAMQRFTRRVAEAAEEKGELRGILEQYDIAVRNAAGNTRRIEDVFRDLADVIQRTQDPAERLRIAFKAFDSEGAALVNTLRDGSAGLDRFAGKARELGVILDSDLIRGSEKAKDAMDDLGTVIQTNFSRTVLENVESITAAVETLAGALGKVAKYSGLRSVLTTSARAAELIKSGDLQMTPYEFDKMGYLERQRLVDETLRKMDQRNLGQYEEYRRRRGKLGVTAGPVAAAGPGGFTYTGAGKMDAHVRARPAVYDQTWGAGELARFAQHDVLVRDSEKAYEEMTGHVRDYADFTNSAYQSMDSRIDTTLSHSAGALAEFTTGAKFKFTDFANSVINDLVRIQSRMALTGLFEYGAGALSGIFGPGSAPTTIRGGQGGGYGFQGGGHIGEAVAGIGLRSGRSYEFHANETVIPDRKLGGGAMTVNVINKSSREVKGRETGRRFDGRAWVIDVVLEDIATNGPLRGVLQGGT